MPVLRLLFGAFVDWFLEELCWRILKFFGLVLEFFFWKKKEAPGSASDKTSLLYR